MSEPNTSGFRPVVMLKSDIGFTPIDIVKDENGNIISLDYCLSNSKTLRAYLNETGENIRSGVLLMH